MPKKTIGCVTIFVMLVIAFCVIRNHLLHDSQKWEDELLEKILALHRDSIFHAQETGVLGIYDPAIGLHGNKRYDLLLEVFSLLNQKDKIHRVVFSGCYSYVIDKNMMKYLASMPDLEVLEMPDVEFQGDDVFTPFAESSNFSSLDIRCCAASIELYKNVFCEKGITRLTLLSPFCINSTDRERRKLSASEIRDIIGELSNATHLDYILLDASFFEHKTDFVPFLPNTTVEFGSIDPYDGTVILREN